MAPLVSKPAVHIAVIRQALVLFGLALTLVGMPAQGQNTGAVSEYALKSALLFKLPLFIYRPNAARNPDYRVCVMGNSPFGGALDKLAQTPIDNRAVVLVRLNGNGDARDCDILFITRSETPVLDAILNRLSKLPTVTVSDIDGFARSGGMVELALGSDANAISILINRKAAQKQNIEFNAQLLRLAKVVDP